MVGISDGGSRQQRLSDVAVAARPRQPDVAGAERVPQVEQHRRLPEAVIRASCRSRARGSSHPEPEDRDAGRAKRRISPPPANNPGISAGGFAGGFGVSAGRFGSAPGKVRQRRDGISAGGSGSAPGRAR